MPHWSLASRRSVTRFLSSAAVALSVVLGVAQTQITPPANSYSPAQDVETGQAAALQARQQLPVMTDDAVNSFVEALGGRLVAAIPEELRHPEFRYSFQTVNVREINAFALPGGPMFVNRGMLEAAKTEGEIAGVMAHELSHVVLRHGTAQASKAKKYEIGQIAGAIAGAIIGGRIGSAVAQGTQFGLGTAFLRFSREFERQADIQGAQIMARANYDPRELANMFKKIEAQGGHGGPAWLSDHPNPGNRYEYILKEAEALHVTNPIGETDGFARLHAHLHSLAPAPTTEQATATAARGGTVPAGTGGRVGGLVEPPSSRFTEYNESNIFRVSVPTNWRERAGSSAVMFAPNGAFGDVNGQSVFTHGVELGISRNETHDLQTATDELISSLSQGNPRLVRSSTDVRRVSIDGHPGLQTMLRNVSEATGRDEIIQVVTTQMRDGNLFYAIAVAPQDELKVYQSVFQKVVRSIKLQN